MPGKKCPNCGRLTFYGNECSSCGYTAHLGPGKGKQCPVCGRYTVKSKGNIMVCNSCGATFS